MLSIVGMAASVLTGSLLPASGAAALPVVALVAALFALHYHRVSQKVEQFPARDSRLLFFGAPLAAGPAYATALPTRTQGA